MTIDIYLHLPGILFMTIDNLFFVLRSAIKRENIIIYNMLKIVATRATRMPVSPAASSSSSRTSLGGGGGEVVFANGGGGGGGEVVFSCGGRLHVPAESSVSSVLPP